MAGEIPKNLGRYEVISLVGRGAMGAVFKAKDPLINRIAAIKCFAISDLLDGDRKKEFKERFLREAKIAGGLKHPNIVTVYDVFEADEIPCIAMEFLEGGSLTKKMKDAGKLPYSESLSIIRQVASALNYANEVGVIHRDIKPDNIVFDLKGKAVITDFGAAHLKGSELTRTGEALGTPYFMSPEQILGEELDGRSDIFSCGVVFYLLLTGKRPFKGDSISSVCYNIVNSPPEPLPTDSNIPPEVFPILKKMLEKKREDRFEKASLAVEAIDLIEHRFTDASSTTQTMDTPIPPVAAKSAIPHPPAEITTPYSVPTQKKRRSLKITAILVILIVLLAGSIILIKTFLRSGAGRFVASLIKMSNTEKNSTEQKPEISSPQQINEEEILPPQVKSSQKGYKNRSTIDQTTQWGTPATQTAVNRIDINPFILNAKESVEMARRHDFASAFSNLDRIEGSTKNFPQGDDADRLNNALSDVKKEIQSYLSDWAKPIIDRGISEYAVATEPVNDDEDKIIEAYVHVYPVIKWKDRMPPVLKESLNTFIENCRGSLNDDEWETAQAKAEGRPVKKEEEDN